MQDERGLVHQRRVKQRQQTVERGNLLARGRQQRRARVGELSADLGEGRQARAQPDQVAGMGHAQRGAARQPFEVADAREQPAQLRARGRTLDQCLHGVLAGGDRVQVEERAQQPLAHQARAHRCRRLVEDAEERHPRIAVARVDQLERLHGGGIERHRRWPGARAG